MGPAGVVLATGVALAAEGDASGLAAGVVLVAGVGPATEGDPSGLEPAEGVS
jgi:hypothetical protein